MRRTHDDLGGSSTKYYRCGDAKKRSTCKNMLSLREDVARTCLLRYVSRGETE